MATDIFIVRILPHKGKGGKKDTFPWIQLSQLDRVTKKRRPKLRIKASGYRETKIPLNHDYPSKVLWKKVARQVGVEILKYSKNIRAYPR